MQIFFDLMRRVAETRAHRKLFLSKVHPSSGQNILLIKDLQTMQNDYVDTAIVELLGYPANRWGAVPSSRWLSLCADLRDYQPPSPTLMIDSERKWELVSALQKSIRRGDKEMALRLISATNGMPDECAYFWRRLCVIACEDVGPADDVLASFVIACSTVFPPKKTGSGNYKLFCFLAEQMCALPTRSRIYCSYSVIEPAAIKAELPELTVQDEAIVSAVMRNREEVQAPHSPWREWQKKNDWRAEKLLRYVGLSLPLEMTKIEEPLPPSRILFDLPSYCFDMHTRVGLRVLQKLVRGVDGAEGIRDFFQENKIKNAHRALGEVLFFVEGARIEGELVYEPLSSLEQRVLAYQYGLPFDRWEKLRFLLEKALQDGIVDRVREEILTQFYGQGNLQLIAAEEDLIRDASN